MSSSVKRPAPDCEYFYTQLRTYQKFNLTLSQLWIEYKERHPDGYQYTQFCEHSFRWRKKLDYCMRQEPRGGEKLFIDSPMTVYRRYRHRRINPYIVICRRLGYFQLYLCRNHHVTNVTGVDQFTQSCISILRVCTSRYGAR